MLATFQHQKSSIFGPQSQLLQMGGGSINPAALTATSPPFQQQQQQQQQHFNSMLQAVGMTREQFQGLSPQDRQTVGTKYMSAYNAHQQQQQQQQQMNSGLNNNAFSNTHNFYDRPSSSASTHSQHQPSSSSQQPSSSTSHHMMPPPPPRPPTAQGGQSQGQGGHSSRPGTSQAHRSPTIPVGQQAQMLEMMQMQQGQQQRSQSRMVCFLSFLFLLYSLTLFSKAHRGDSMMNGFNNPMGVKPSNQQQQGLFPGLQHQLSQHSQPQSQSSGSNSHQQQNQYSNQPPQTTSSPPAMDSPYRGATRKLGGDINSAPGSGAMKLPVAMAMGGPASPRIGGGLGLTGPGNITGAGGLAPGSGVMGPPGLPRSISGDTISMNMINLNNHSNMINGQHRQSPRPQSSMGMNPDMSSRLGISTPASAGSQQQQQQRQGSMPPQQFSNSQQQQMRQGSLPPGTGPGQQQQQQQQQQRQKMSQDGMNMNIGAGGMGMMNMGGNMLGMKPNNEMRASMPSTSTTPMNMMGMNQMGGMGNLGGMNSSLNNMGGMNSSLNNMGGMNSMNVTMNIPPAPHSVSSASSAPHTPASPLIGGGGQVMIPSLSASSIGSITTAGQMAIPSIQQTPIATSASNADPTTTVAGPGTSSTPTAVASTSTTAAGAPSSTSSLPALPPLNPSTTQITTFPLSTSHLHIPTLTPPEISEIQGWMKKDQAYEVLLGKSKERMVEEVREALGNGGGIGGMAAPGWWETPGTGNYNRWRRRGEMFEVRYPKTKREREREREREGRGKKSIRREGLKLYASFAFYRSFILG